MAGAPITVQLDRVEDDLKLEEPQRAAWNAYADKVQKLADTVSRSRFDARTARTASVPATQQLEQLAASERTRIAALDEIAELGRSLYALLTPEQKAIADRRLAVPVLSLVTGVTPPGSDAAERPPRRRP
jgi:hypothetical protein